MNLLQENIKFTLFVKGTKKLHLIVVELFINFIMKVYGQKLGEIRETRKRNKNLKKKGNKYFKIKS